MAGRVIESEPRLGRQVSDSCDIIDDDAGLCNKLIVKP